MLRASRKKLLYCLFVFALLYDGRVSAQNEPGESEKCRASLMILISDPCG